MKRVAGFVVLIFAFSAHAEDLDIIFVDADIPARAPASAYPKELDPAFEAQAPTERDPASISQPKANSPVKAILPPQILEGFEVRAISPIQHKGEKPVISTFRIERNRVGTYLRFRNSSGSQSEVPLSADSFGKLRRRASAIPTQSVNLKTCAGAMQLIEKKKDGERLTTYCLNSRTKAAEELRSLGNLLVTWVR